MHVERYGHGGAAVLLLHGFGTNNFLWRAVAPVAMPAGAQVRVVRVSGLTVHVMPAESGAR